MRFFIHMILHFAVPAALARAAGKDGWKTRCVQALSAMVIDLDHLVATPILDPNRCSVGFHPLHTEWAAIAYICMTFVPKIRWFGIGLIVHLLLDSLDCAWMLSV
jgi:hypothetical protein